MAVLFPISICFANPHKGIKVAVLDFFPLPTKFYAEAIEDKDVFTGEVYKHPKYGQILVPSNYLDIIQRNISVLGQMQALDIRLIESPNNIPADTDYLVIGNVTKFHASGNKAQVSLNAQIVDMQDLSVRASLLLNAQAPAHAFHLSPAQPIHTVGEHGDDFHGLRTLLNHTCYQSLQKLFTEIEKVRR